MGCITVATPKDVRDRDMRPRRQEREIRRGLKGACIGALDVCVRGVGRGRGGEVSACMWARGMVCEGGATCPISASAEVAGWAVPLLHTHTHTPSLFLPPRACAHWIACHRRHRGHRADRFVVVGIRVGSPTTNLNSSKTFQRRTIVGCVTSDR